MLEILLYFNYESQQAHTQNRNLVPLLDRLGKVRGRMKKDETVSPKDVAEGCSRKYFDYNQVVEIDFF